MANMGKDKPVPTTVIPPLMTKAPVPSTVMPPLLTKAPVPGTTVIPPLLTKAPVPGTTVIPPLMTKAPVPTAVIPPFLNTPAGANTASVSLSSSASSTVILPSQTQPVDMATHSFKRPEKAVSLPEHIPQWEQSEGYHDVVGFILTINEAVKDKKLTDECHTSELTTAVVALLGELERWLTEIPAIEQPQRFGNKAFRDWYSRLSERSEELLKKALSDKFWSAVLERSEELLKKALPEKFWPAVPEVAVYLTESFGNSTRIDYGTGHELAFAAFLCCLCKVGAFLEEDHPALCLKIFNRYLLVARALQTTYRMEPAGSHGVWSLDDFQFLPFLWGSAQLMNNKRILPKSVVKPDIYESFAKDFLFLAAIRYISLVKTGPFAEHSNQLWNISGVAHWTKVNSGLVKMYRAEVLAKHPIVQHFLFGSLLTMTPAT